MRDPAVFCERARVRTRCRWSGNNGPCRLIARCGSPPGRARRHRGRGSGGRSVVAGTVGLDDDHPDEPAGAGDHPTAGGRDPTHHGPGHWAADHPASGGGDPLFLGHVQDLWRAVVDGQPQEAGPFFFPLRAYVQVKAISDPVHDYQSRLIADFDQDIQTLHASLGAAAGSATFTGVTVPDAAEWIVPGVEYNKGSYWRVYGARVAYTVAGRAGSFEITSMISWRGEWYVVAPGPDSLTGLARPQAGLSPVRRDRRRAHRRRTPRVVARDRVENGHPLRVRTRMGETDDRTAPPRRHSSHPPRWENRRHRAGIALRAVIDTSDDAIFTTRRRRADHHLERHRPSACSAAAAGVIERPIDALFPEHLERDGGSHGPSHGR